MTARHPVSSSDFSTPSLDRALAVLECLASRSGGLTQTELAAELGLTANFVLSHDAVAARPRLPSSRRGQAIPAHREVVAARQPVLDDVPLAEASLPAMRWLSEETGEASHLGIVTDGAGLVLERVIGTAPIKFYVERGTRFPIHTSAPGKCLLAFADVAEREEILSGYRFEAFQPWTISNREDFDRCLGQVRTGGFATDLGEHLEGHHCLGVPVFDRDDRAVASNLDHRPFPAPRRSPHRRTRRHRHRGGADRDAGPARGGGAMSARVLAACFLGALLTAPSAAADEAAITGFLDQHCTTCHDEPRPKAN